MKHFFGVILTITLIFSSPTTVGWALMTSREQPDDDAGGQVRFYRETYQHNLKTVLLAQASSVENAAIPAEGPAALPQQKLFKTKYTQIYYAQDADLDDFIWRLGGKKLEFANDPNLASTRIDRLVSRVQMILDMWPEKFQVTIYLYRGPLEKNEAAYYEYRSQSIHVSIDHASDGILAHELAHAAIDQYFAVAPPPAKCRRSLPSTLIKICGAIINDESKSEQEPRLQLDHTHYGWATCRGIIFPYF